MNWWHQWQLRQLAEGDVFLLHNAGQYQLWRLQRQSPSGLSLRQLGEGRDHKPSIAELRRLSQLDDGSKRRDRWLLTRDELLALRPKRIKRGSERG